MCGEGSLPSNRCQCNRSTAAFSSEILIKQKKTSPTKLVIWVAPSLPLQTQVDFKAKPRAVDLWVAVPIMEWDEYCRVERCLSSCLSLCGCLLICETEDSSCVFLRPPSSSTLMGVCDISPQAACCSQFATSILLWDN